MDKKIGKGDILNNMALYAMSCALKVAKATNFQLDKDKKPVLDDKGNKVTAPLANPRNRTLKLVDFVEYMLNEDKENISDDLAVNIRRYITLDSQHKFEKARAERELRAKELDAASAKYLDGLL